MPFVAIALCLAAAPVGTLIGLALTGVIAPGPAVACIGVTILSIIAFTLVWARDLDLLTSAVREIEAETAGQPTTETVGPTLMEPLGLELARLSRHLAAKSALIEQERRADT